MVSSRHIYEIFKKDLALEIRKKYALGGIFLYIFCTVFIVYLSFKHAAGVINPVTWNTLFWIVILFSAITSCARSFSSENSNSFFYYYNLFSPSSLIISRLIFNVLLMVVLSMFAFFTFSIFLDNPVQDIKMYLVSVLFGSVSIAISLTMVSSIAALAGNSGAMMAVLGFPILIPILVILIKVSRFALDGLDLSLYTQPFITLLAIDLILISLSLFLFPYLWKK